MRSDAIKKGISKAPHRALLYSTGVSKKNIDKPFIGIASSFTDIVPGHIGMRDLERQIKVFSRQVGRLLFLEHLQFVMVWLWGMVGCVILCRQEI